MTRIDELKSAFDHLMAADESISKAIRSAVLSRKRRAEIDKAQRDLGCTIGGIQEELERRSSDTSRTDRKVGE